MKTKLPTEAEHLASRLEKHPRLREHMEQMLEMVEDVHGYIVQQRLKRPGAWWKAANAESMLALRTARANGH